jgi:hypothetical protein
MTPKQEERIRNKIARIKKGLAADKRFWHGYYHDGGGLRYSPPGLYIKLADYKGGMRYLRWFEKNFPNDAAHGLFLFEWAILLFKTGKTHECMKKIVETFKSHFFLTDTFLERELLSVEMTEHLEWQKSSLPNYFTYRHTDPALLDFGGWLMEFVESQAYKAFVTKYVELEIRYRATFGVPLRSKISEEQRLLEP